MKVQVSLQGSVTVTLAGFVISFFGSLPLGTMNVTATHISIQQGTTAGLIFGAGAMLVELIVVRAVLVGMSWLARRHKLFFALELVTLVLMIALSTASFIAAYKMKGFSGSFRSDVLPPFWSGVLISALNPLHVPFWVGWSTVLLNKKILLPFPKQYNLYILGIGTGTMMGFMVFVYGGYYFVSQISDHQNLLNCAVGMALLITAILQIRKMVTQPLSVRYHKILQ
jgi:threonine/homoserine/homoserine lactone efflux protein